MMTGCRAGTLILALIALHSGVSRADVVVHARTRAFMIAGAEGETVTHTRGDRRCEEIVLRSSDAAASPDVHLRTIVRLDKGLVWAIHLEDSTYTETTFQRANPRHVTQAPVSLWKELEPAMITGIRTRHWVWSPPAHWSPAPEPVFRMDAWIAVDFPGSAKVAAFERAFAAASGMSTVAFLGSGPNPLQAFGAPLPPGLVIRSRCLHKIRRIGDRPRPTPTERDAAEMRAVGFAPEEGGIEASWGEVTRVEQATVADAIYELPPGLRKTPNAIDRMDREDSTRRARPVARRRR